MPHLDQQKFFITELRSGPGLIGWKTPGGRYQQEAFATVLDALAIIVAHRHEANIWCSMADFHPGASREAENALSLKAFWLDKDAHSPGQTPDDAIGAVYAFVAAAGLPNPDYMHMTGHGAQAFWVLREPISKAEWQPVANDLQELAKRMNLGADPITADAARILRVPRTYNFRDPDNPVETVLHKVKVGYTDLPSFHAGIIAALSKFPDAAPKPKKLLPPGIPDTAENAELIKAMLSYIDPDSEYEVWRNNCWAVAASGLAAAEEIASDWSAEGASWDEEAFKTVWKSYNPDRGNAVGFGTLVHHARAAGYTGPTPRALEYFDKLEFRNAAGVSPAITIAAKKGLVTQRASDIEPERIEWLVEGAIPMGMLVVIGGQPGMGKSQIAIKLAAAVTTGEGLPNV